MDLQVTEHGTPADLLALRAGWTTLGDSKPPVQEVFRCRLDYSFPETERGFIYVLYGKVDKIGDLLHQNHLESLEIQICWVWDGNLRICIFFFLKNLNQIYRQLWGN